MSYCTSMLWNIFYNIRVHDFVAYYFGPSLHYITASQKPNCINFCNNSPGTEIWRPPINKPESTIDETSWFRSTDFGDFYVLNKQMQDASNLVFGECFLTCQRENLEEWYSAEYVSDILLLINTYTRKMHSMATADHSAALGKDEIFDFSCKVKKLF